MQKEGYEAPPLTDSEIEAFMRLALSRIGAEELITPREIIRDFLTLLNILRDNKGARFEDIIKDARFETAEKTAEPQGAPLNAEKIKNKIMNFNNSDKELNYSLFN